MSAEIDPKLIGLVSEKVQSAINLYGSALMGLYYAGPEKNKLLTLIGELVRERDAAIGFSGVILKSARDHIGCDVDGGDVQDAAAKYGLLEKVLVSEPCGEYCVCQEYEFPTDCYPFTALGKLALKKAADE